MDVTLEKRLHSIENALAQLIKMVGNVIEDHKVMRADIDELKENQKKMSNILMKNIKWNNLITNNQNNLTRIKLIKMSYRK